LTGCSAFTPTPEPPTSTSVPTENPGPQSRSEVPRISPEELKDRLDNGEAILVVDSRSLSSFEMEHIAGAISVPDYEVESRLAEFPRDQEIVFY
jgi:3-mercaptopyruvate sulfurtransferase SseA